MLKIRTEANGKVVFHLSGIMNAEEIAILRDSIHNEADGRAIVLDLAELRLVDRQAVQFLEYCERQGITVMNAPRYITLWIEGERNLRRRRRAKRLAGMGA
jgi:hypothetical protein